MREIMPLARRNPQKRVKAIEHKLYLKLKHNLKANQPSKQIKSKEIGEVAKFQCWNGIKNNTTTCKQHMYNMLGAKSIKLVKSTTLEACNIKLK